MIKNRQVGKYVLGVAICIILPVVFVFAYTSSLPDMIEIFENETKVIDVGFPFSLTVDEAQTVLQQSNEKSILKNSVNIKPTGSGNSTLFFTLFDKIKLKEISVNVIPKSVLVPGGQSIGVKMNIKGVLVVGLEEIPITGGKVVNPGLSAGLEIGDTIMEINGEEIHDSTQVQKIINETDQPGAVQLKIKRNNNTQTIMVTPVLSADENQYRMGLWVRDKTAGIGTLTFYNPSNNTFGALGHAITDADTGIILDVQNGEILHSKIVSIKHGEAGSPGEVRGIFYETDKPLGKLFSNTEQGVFGTAYEEIASILSDTYYEIGYQNEVKKGKATILTTLDSGEIEEYEIMIEKVNKQLTSDTKSMVIRVTDERLLEKSGGIIQGMSGSPILQNGKIIGAVTHVFVNNPEKGYGIFIEWMLKQADKAEKKSA